MLDTIRSFVGADRALLLSWRSDDVALVLDSAPATTPVRTSRLARAQLALHDGVILDAEESARFLAGAFAVPFSNPIRSALMCFAPIADGKDKASNALLFIWHERAAMSERLEEWRPLVAAELHSALAHRNAVRATSRLGVIMEAAPQGIIFVDDEHGDADVNGEAARLLGVPSGFVSALEFEGAMRLLHARLVQRDDVESEYTRLATDPDTSVRDWIWEFADSADTTLRVASIPYVEVAGCGRLWMFESVSAERQLQRQLARRRYGVIKELLAFSGQLLAQPSILDVDELLRKIAPWLADSIDEPWSLSVQPEAMQAHAWIDERQLSLTLLTLLAAACETMGAGGVVTLRSARLAITNSGASESGHPERWVAIALSNTDERIPTVVPENLHESFGGLRTDSARAGLGLETIVALVEQAGGTIRYTAGASTGTSYTLYLPEADSQPAVSRQHTPAPRVHIPAHISELPILVVDDDAGPRRVVRRLLEREGHQVLTAESAPEALRQLETLDGQLSGVISDYLMPGMSGMELLTRIRAQWPDLPVVLVSGFTSDEVTGVALRDLRAHFLAKPFTRDELLGAIRAAKIGTLSGEAP